jgi:hypothetical protein
VAVKYIHGVSRDPGPCFCPGGGGGVLPKSCALDPRHSRPAPLPTAASRGRGTFGFGSAVVRFCCQTPRSAADLRGAPLPPNGTAAESFGNMQKPAKPRTYPEK